jgi:hypothetical protein
MYNTETYTKIKLSDFAKLNRTRKNKIFWFYKIRKGNPTDSTYEISKDIGYCRTEKAYYLDRLNGYLGETHIMKPNKFILVDNADLTVEDIFSFRTKYIEPK